MCEVAGRLTAIFANTRSLAVIATTIAGMERVAKVEPKATIVTEDAAQLAEYIDAMIDEKLVGWLKAERPTPRTALTDTIGAPASILKALCVIRPRGAKCLDGAIRLCGTVLGIPATIFKDMLAISITAPH